MNQLNFEKQHQLQLTQSSTMQLDHQVMDCQLNLYLLQSNIVQTDTIVSNSVSLGFICQFSQFSSNLLRFFLQYYRFQASNILQTFNIFTNVFGQGKVSHFFLRLPKTESKTNIETWAPGI